MVNFNTGLTFIAIISDCKKTPRPFSLCYEGPEGVKWELGLPGFFPGKMGFKPLGLGFGHREWE